MERWLPFGSATIFWTPERDIKGMSSKTEAQAQLKVGETPLAHGQERAMFRNLQSSLRPAQPTSDSLNLRCR